jgi:hypothetical protein
VTGLYRFGARDYDTTTGEWKEQDPDGYVNGKNTYLFEGGDSVDHTDPSGRLFGAFTAIGAIFGAIGGAGMDALGQAGNGHFCWQELAGAAIGGAYSGAIGGMVADSLTGDPELAVIAGVASGMAGLATSPAVLAGADVGQAIAQASGGTPAAPMPTPAPTTQPTTAPTTAPTTQPTTAPTTQPTTAPTTQSGPAVNEPDDSVLPPAPPLPPPTPLTQLLMNDSVEPSPTSQPSTTTQPSESIIWNWMGNQ